MCNEECPEISACCLCQWSREPYECFHYKCGEHADFCSQDDMYVSEDGKYEPPEPPYNYVKIRED